MNIPDTDWEWISEDRWHQTWHHKEYGDRLINTELLNFILNRELQKARKERDTYWKEMVRKEGIVQGIELARKYMRSSREECMCNEKNHNQFDRLLKGEFEGFTPTPITNKDNLK